MLMSMLISRMMKEQKFDFFFQCYKLVLLGHIFQNGGQSVRVASKCLWDPQNDNFADYNYVDDELTCSIQVFGIYIQ